MKPLIHHISKLLELYQQAELATNREQAKAITLKAEKHAKKIARWHQKMQAAGLWGRP